MRAGLFPAVLFAMLITTPVVSAEVATYHYDALGRMAAEDHRRGVGNGWNALHFYDNAGNRSLLTASGPYIPMVVPSGTLLSRGQAVLSSDNRYLLVFQSDSNLVLYDQSWMPTWNTLTQGSGATAMVMQTDGNLVLYTQNGVPVWSTNTHGKPGSRLLVQTDGNVVVYTPADVPVWAIWGCC